MSVDLWSVSKGKLEEWRNKLDNYSVTEVQEEIEEILANMGSLSSSDSSEETELTMAHMQVGQTYYFKPLSRTRNEYHNRSCKLLKKNRTRVEVELLENITGRIKKGEVVSVRPEALALKPQL